MPRSVLYRLDFNLHSCRLWSSEQQCCGLQIKLDATVSWWWQWRWWSPWPLQGADGVFRFKAWRPEGGTCGMVGVSMARMLSWCPTNILLPYVSIILFTIPPSPASRETILPFKGPQLPQSAHFWVVSSPGPTYATVSRQLHLRHSRSSRAHIAMGSLMPVMKQQLMWQWSGTSADWLM